MLQPYYITAPDCSVKSQSSCSHIYLYQIYPLPRWRWKDFSLWLSEHKQITFGRYPYGIGGPVKARIYKKNKIIHLKYELNPLLQSWSLPSMTWVNVNGIGSMAKFLTVDKLISSEGIHVFPKNNISVTLFSMETISCWRQKMVETDHRLKCEY